MSSEKVSDDAKCYYVLPSSHDLVYLQNSSSFPKLILVKTDHPAYTHCWSSRGIQGHWPSSSILGKINYINALQTSYICNTIGTMIWSGLKLGLKTGKYIEYF